MTLTVVYAIFFYLATLIFTIGVARKIYIYAKTPAPLKIPTTPAPMTRMGVVWRMAKEVTVFESLFKANKWICAYVSADKQRNLHKLIEALYKELNLGNYTKGKNYYE